MAVNYNDERFAKVEAEKQAALNEVDKTYGEMIGKSDGYYQAQIDASKQWADKQSQLQQEKTDFAIQEIEQQKAQEKKEYTREQSGAFVDWQKQSNQYGATAEQQAAAGLTNTGYSESSQVSMFNAYQNRIATAREAYTLAIQNYNNAITEARLQNNSILAEIAYEALQQQLELSLQGFQYKNQLIAEKLNAKNSISSEYWGRYTDVLDQINTENALAEEIRQYNASLAEEKRQYNSTLALQQAQLAEEKRQFDAQQAAKAAAAVKGGGGGGGGAKGSGTGRDSVKKSSVKSSSNTVKHDSKTNTSYTTGKSNAATNKSILALGQGPISAKNLAKQVAAGTVKETKDKAGNTTFMYNYSRTGLKLKK